MKKYKHGLISCKKCNSDLIWSSDGSDLHILTEKEIENVARHYKMSGKFTINDKIIKGEFA